MDVEEIKKKRLKYLDKVYTVTGANPFNYAAGTEISTDLGYGKSESQSVVDYLQKERLVDVIPFTGSVSITHEGIMELEQGYNHPQEATTHFPPINVVNVANMSNSQIQQGVSSSSQTQSTSEREIHVRNISDDKKKGYVAGVVSILIGVIFGVVSFNFGWDTTRQIVTAFSVLFSILGIGSLIKPDTIGVITSSILENIGKNTK